MLNFDPRGRLPALLLVDDDLVCREVNATLLTMSGYSVHTADSGETSLNMLDHGVCSPGVILMDAQMPGLSGVALMAAYRQRSRALVYVISASRPPMGVMEAADGLLTKPFAVEDLAHLLARRKLAEPEDESSLSEPALPVVNPETLAQLRVMMQPKAVREIYQAVIVDLRQRAILIGQALERADLAEVRRLGHAIKGGCGMAGAQQAARIGALLEELDNQLDDSRALLEDLRAATVRLERILESELAL